MNTDTPLQRAIRAAGSMTALGAAIGVKRQVVHHWQVRGIPAEYCPLIEQATKVRCEELRPDIAWGVLRINPAPVQPAPSTLAL